MDKLEKQRLANKKWYEKNKAAISVKRKGSRHEEHLSYYQKNKETIIKATKEWAKKNPEKVKEIQKKSRRSNDKRRLFNLIKNRSKNKDIDFDLTIDDIIIPEFCPYLGTVFIYGDPNKGMSVDRIDNTKGYVKGNIEVISIQANKMKNVASINELKIFAKNILIKYEDI